MTTLEPKGSSRLNTRCQHAESLKCPLRSFPLRHHTLPDTCSHTQTHPHGRRGEVRQDVRREAYFMGCPHPLFLIADHTPLTKSQSDFLNIEASWNETCIYGLRWPHIFLLRVASHKTSPHLQLYHGRMTSLNKPFESHNGKREKNMRGEKTRWQSKSTDLTIFCLTGWHWKGTYTYLHKELQAELVS